MIKVVVFDLDDTLAPETEYVKSGFRAIAKAKGDKALGKKLWRLFKENRADVYQRAGFSPEQTAEAIAIYRSHMPAMKLKRSTKKALSRLRRSDFSIGIITDGRPEGQRNKIAALGLEGLVDHIIVTDELGGIEFRKPNPAAFAAMREFFGVEFGEMIYIGDNPKKDFIAPKQLGMKTCLFVNRNGLYFEENAETDFRIKKIPDILKLLKGGKA